MRSYSPSGSSFPASCAAILFCLSVPAAASDDWPQYNGASHDRSSAETVELRSWPEAGPPVAWMTETNLGFSSFSIAKGMAFTLVSRVVDGAAHEVCVALDARTGEELWATPLSRSKYDGGGDRGTSSNSGGDGPRSTPSHAGEQLFVLDAKLMLSCLDDKTGELLWDRDIVEQLGGRNITWQNAASPLIDDGRVFLAGGGAGQSLIAVDANTGELLWKILDERMTHATPIIATIHDVRQVIFFVQSGLISVEPESGSVLWRAEFPFRTSTAASPVVYQDIVYCSAGYGVGAGAFRISKKDGGFEAEGMWRERNGLMNHWSTPVCKDGFLYGMFSFKKYGEGPLQCVDIRTGKVRWSEDGFGPGNCILVGSDLVALGDAGQVVLVEAVPDEYRELARAQVLDGKCWSTPVFSEGQLYLRSTTQAARLDLTAAAQR